jgi:hypothetical protein
MKSDGRLMLVGSQDGRSHRSHKSNSFLLLAKLSVAVG